MTNQNQPQVEFLSEKNSKLWKNYTEMEVGDLRKEYFVAMDETRRLMRVPSGWVFTTIRESNIESVFIPLYV